MGVGEWNGMGEYPHHHHHYNQYINSMLLTVVVLFCSRLYFLSAFLYWMAYSGKDGVECGGQSGTGRVELSN